MKKKVLISLAVASIVVVVILIAVFIIPTKENLNDKSLVNAPTEKYIVDCLKTVPGITAVEAVTEYSDQNNLLNKAGGYYSCVYFSYKLIDQSQIVGSTLIKKGTAAGGCIEAFYTKEDANKRNEYLSTFDGTVLASGSHKIEGTLIIRTSNNLKSSQQVLLENNIIAVLNEKIENVNKNIGSEINGGNYTDNDYEDFIIFPATTIDGLANIYVSYFDSDYLEYSIIKIERYSYGYNDSVSGKLTIKFTFICEICYLDWPNDEFAFNIVVYDRNLNTVCSKSVIDYGNEDEKVKVESSITLNISDVINGVLIDFVDCVENE